MSLYVDVTHTPYLGMPLYQVLYPCTRYFGGLSSYQPAHITY